MKILRDLAGRLRHCRKGVATIEFVIVLPVGIVVYLGLIELNNYISTYTKVIETALEIEDLVGRQSTVSCDPSGGSCGTSTTFGHIATLASTILSPTPISGMTLTITNETIVSGTLTAGWTIQCTGATTFTCNKLTAATVTLPTTITNLNVGTGKSTDSATILSTWSYLVVSASYTYNRITQNATYGLLPYNLTLPAINYTKFGFFRNIYSKAVTLT